MNKKRLIPISDLTKLFRENEIPRASWTTKVVDKNYKNGIGGYGTFYDAIKGEGYTFERISDSNQVSFIFHGHTEKRKEEFKKTAIDLFNNSSNWELVSEFTSEITVRKTQKKV